MDPIIPIKRADPFDDDARLFELKLDGFRGKEWLSWEFRGGSGWNAQGQERAGNGGVRARPRATSTEPPQIPKCYAENLAGDLRASVSISPSHCRARAG
jgi:hypothetical protein